MTAPERDILRLWDKAIPPELIAKYLMIKQEKVQDIIECQKNYEEEK